MEKSPRKTSGYSPSEVQAVRTDAISSIVDSQRVLLEKATERTDLNDTATVAKVADRLMAECARTGLIPSVEMLAAGLGVSRTWLYRFLDKHPDHSTTVLIDKLRTGWAGIRIAAADRGLVDSTMSIFLLLNSNLSFSNTHNIEIAQPKNILDDAGDPAAARQRYLAAIPEMLDESD